MYRSAKLKESLYDSKLEAIVIEYNHLLTTQLESHRHYYKGLLIDIKKQRD